jgi:hypothetical protein
MTSAPLGWFIPSASRWISDNTSNRRRCRMPTHCLTTLFFEIPLIGAKWHPKELPLPGNFLTLESTDLSDACQHGTLSHVPMQV